MSAASPQPVPTRRRGAGLVLLLLGAAGCAGKGSIYPSADVEAAMLEGYASRIAGWSLPVESRYVGTRYGVAHVAVVGPAEAPPLVLLHAMGVTSTMWRANVEALSRHRRLYCVDFIGDVGRSRLAEGAHPPDGPSAAAWVAEVMERLGLEQADVVGSSFGGWVALNLAAHQPERVRRVALLGPMGIAPVTGEVVQRVMALLLFPTPEKKREVVRWTLGDDAAVLEELGPHMTAAMDVKGRLATPTELTEVELRRIRAPVLLVLGAKDPLTGAPDAARARVRRNLPGAELHVLDAGHMLNVERSEAINALLGDFLTREAVANSR